MGTPDTTNHAERDLHRWDGAGRRLGVEPYHRQVTLQQNAEAPLQEVRLPVSAPHMVFPALYRAGELHWHVSALGAGREGDLRVWWHHALATDWATRHPGAQRLLRDWRLQLFKPLLFHQDGVEVCRDLEGQIISFSAALSSGDSRDCKFIPALPRLPAHPGAPRRSWGQMRAPPCLRLPAPAGALLRLPALGAAQSLRLPAPGGAPSACRRSRRIPALGKGRFPGARHRSGASQASLGDS